jgi:DNA-binding NtrC family response regulator
MLKKYDWEGNVRELENAVFHAVSMCDEVIYPEHLPESIQQSASSRRSELVTESVSLLNDALESKEADEHWLTLAGVEAKYAARVLTHTGWNKQAAARLLGIDYKTLARIIKRYGIKP